MTAAKKITVRAPNAAEQQLKKDMAKALDSERSILMLLHPFTASLAMRLNMVVVVDDRLPTAATDGETLFFNAKFMQQRSAQDRRFIVAHEVWHCVLAHNARMFWREANLWNYAADYEINHILDDELKHHPKDALYNSSYISFSAEEIYTKLQKRNQQNPLPKRKTLDEHDVWELLAKDGVVIDPDFTPRMRPSSSKRAEEAKGWQEKMLVAAKNIGAGNLPSSIKSLIDKIAKPAVPWQRLLERFLQRQSRGDERQWFPPSRRHIYRGLYLPSTKGSKLSAAVAIDTSGSCLNELGIFIGELKSILGGFNQVELKVYCFDTEVHTIMELTHNDLARLDNISLRAGGGTSFQPVFHEIEKHSTPEALIFFTDGFAYPPKEPSYPVLWVLTEDGRKPVEWGEEVRVSRS